MPSGAGPGGGMLLSTVGSNGEVLAVDAAGCSGIGCGPSLFQDRATPVTTTPAVRSAMAGQRLREDGGFLPMRLKGQNVQSSGCMQVPVAAPILESKTARASKPPAYLPIDNVPGLWD